MIRNVYSILLTITAIGLSACAQHPATVAVPALDLSKPLPAIAVAYRTTRSVDETAHTDREHSSKGTVFAQTEWHFFREDNRVEVEDLNSQTGELWQRDGATQFFYKLFHVDRRGIEYRMDDLKILEISPAWEQHTLLIDPKALQALPEHTSGWRDGYPYRHLRGEFEGSKMDVVWRVDLNVPVLIERSHDGHRERTELIEVHPLAESPWARRNSKDYEFIDFADLGDRETDEFVQRVQHLLPGGHPHHH